MDYYYYYIDRIKNNKRYVSKRPIEVLAKNLEESEKEIDTLVKKYELLKTDFHSLGSTTTKRHYEKGVTENPNKSLELKVIKKYEVLVTYPLKHVRVLRYKDDKGLRKRINLTKNFKIVFMNPVELDAKDFVMFKLINTELTFVSFISKKEKERLQGEIEAWEKLQKHNS